jgi:uncharacterized membrane protein YfcA
VLIFTSLASVVAHVLDGTFTSELPRLAILAVGVVGGAQLGAWLSRHLKGPWIVRALALALLLGGGRLVWGAFG